MFNWVNKNRWLRLTDFEYILQRSKKCFWTSTSGLFVLSITGHWIMTPRNTLRHRSIWAGFLFWIPEITKNLKKTISGWKRSIHSHFRIQYLILTRHFRSSSDIKPDFQNLNQNMTTTSHSRFQLTSRLTSK